MDNMEGVNFVPTDNDDCLIPDISSGSSTINCASSSGTAISEDGQIDYNDIDIQVDKDANYNDERLDEIITFFHSEPESGIGRSVSPISKKLKESKKKTHTKKDNNNKKKSRRPTTSPAISPELLLTPLSRPKRIESGVVTKHSESCFLVSWENPNQKPFKFYTPVRFLKKHFTQFLINYYLSQSEFVSKPDSDTESDTDSD